MIPVIGELGYIALTAFAINALIAAVVTVVLNAMNVAHGPDETTPMCYLADEGDPRADKKRIEHTLPSI
jgi:SSS family solute:Na+ symporter